MQRFKSFALSRPIDQFNNRMNKRKTIELYKSGKKKVLYYYRIIAPNGKNIDGSQGHTRKWSAKKQAVKKCPDGKIVDLTKNGKRNG